MEVPVRKGESQRGLVLALTIILILGVSAISVGTMYTSKIGRMSASNYGNKAKAFLASDGVMTLLAQEIINGNGSKYIDATRMGEIDGELWTGIGGTDIAKFVNVTSKTTPPSEKLVSTYLGSILDRDSYGVKWTGWIIPPLSGTYTFYTRSDDGSRFFLSKDESKDNLSADPVCYQNGWAYDWPTSGSAVSKPIPLLAGNRYYFEYYHKEGVGFDVGQVGWSGPEYFSELPITGQHLSRYPSDPPWAGEVKVGGIPVRYQVQGAGLHRYRLSSESIITRPKATQDTIFRTPLTQILSLKGDAAKPPDKMWLRVIHYDYPADGRANEFNQPVRLGVYKDMVQPVLTNYTSTDAAFFGRSTIPKPTRNLITPNRNCGLSQWFQVRSSQLTRPFYTNANDYKANNCTATEPVPFGGSWTSKKVYDSLEFKLVPTQGPSTYVYSRMGNYDTGDPTTSFRGDPSEYFPKALDDLGQDPAGAGHNFGFCTELHTTFIYQSGLKFEFTGDDDVWVFVNGKLAIDLGGIHGSTSAFLQLDDLHDLEFGKEYTFDFFQCERMQWHSTSRIVTNIKMLPPQGKPVAQWRRDYSSSN